MSSVQLDRYLAERAGGATMMTAAARSGLGIGEARLTENDIARGDLVLTEPTPAKEGSEMPKNEEQTSVEVKAPDFALAVRIFRSDIKPASEKVGEHSQTASTAYKKIKEAGVNTRAAKFVFKLAGESEEKRNDVLRSLRGLLDAMEIGITDDLVSDAEGEDTAAAIVPTAAGERLQPATLN